MKTKAFDLVIFDMDGTLLDSMGCLADWIHRAVKEHCPPSLTPADITAAFGPTERKIIEKFVARDLVQPCLNAYHELYESEHNRIYIYPGIDLLLRELHRKGIPMALCTGKSRRAVEISLELMNWEDFFGEIITGDDTKNPKPDPEGANIILERTKAARQRTIFIGDGSADTGAARGAGIVCGRAEWGEPGNLPEGSAQPEYRFSTPQEFLDILDRAAK
ncbi:MAG: HAD family hydrolase [Elusimicrobiales bacterium]|nr:HAD family hydrolase [Elusimicrobiales bacterium]